MMPSVVQPSRFRHGNAPRGDGECHSRYAGARNAARGSGRAALRSKLNDLGFDLADNQLNDVFVRFKALADRKKEVYDEERNFDLTISTKF